jgi:hypothetical protein
MDITFKCPFKAVYVMVVSNGKQGSAGIGHFRLEFDEF